MINETINLLGLKAKDKVTGYTGTVASVSFDLYGCVQVALTPLAGKDGKVEPGHYFDVARLEILKDKRVMSVPAFKAFERVEDFNHGAAGISHDKY